MPDPIYVTRSFLPRKEAYLKYLERPWASAMLTNHGELCQELESRLKKLLNVNHLVLVSNGSLALHLAYKALGLKGDVLTTPFTFAATSSVLRWENCNPIFCDIDRKTFCLSPQKVEEKITKAVSGIVPVHVFGNACDVEKFEEIRLNHPGLKIIYDAAHAFGVEYTKENGKVGSLLEHGDASILSFHATKVFHCIEGGAVIVKDKDTENKIREFINFGYDPMGGGKLNPLGTNCKLSEFHAAMGLAVLDNIDLILEKRRKIVENYRRQLSNELEFQVHNKKSSENYAYFPVILKDEIQLKNLVILLNSKCIFPRRYFYPSLDTISYSTGESYCPNSREISKRILCLPLFPDLNENTQSGIIKLINDFLKK